MRTNLTHKEPETHCSTGPIEHRGEFLVEKGPLIETPLRTCELPVAPAADSLLRAEERGPEDEDR